MSSNLFFFRSPLFPLTHATSFCQVHAGTVGPQTEGSLAGADDVSAGQDSSADTVGDAEEGAAQLTGKQTGENIGWHSAAEPRLLFNLTRKFSFGIFPT